MTNKTTPPCAECGTNKWHTLSKGVAWACRNCHRPRSTNPLFQAFLDQQYIAAQREAEEEEKVVEKEPEKPSTPWVEKTEVSDNVSIQLS